MISDLEEVLRQLFIRELPVKNGEVNIEFHQPKREWSSRLSRPTLNVFLYDIHENSTLRQPEWQVERNNGKAVKRRTPVRIDLHYMITAWANEPEDEHRLLTRTLLALYRNPELAEDLLPESLRSQPVPIPVRVAEHDALRNAADIWGVLDNELRPAVACTVTLALNPYQPVTGPLVRTRDLRFVLAQGEPGEGDQFWMVGGIIQSQRPLEDLRLTLVERGLPVPVKEGGQFIIHNLEAGEYTLEVSAKGRKPAHHKLIVPSEEYIVNIDTPTK